MRIDNKKGAREKSLRRLHDGHDVPSDDAPDPLDSTNAINRQLKVVNYQTELKKIHQEEEEKQENEQFRLLQQTCDKRRAAKINTGNTAALVPTNENEDFDEDTCIEGCVNGDDDVDPDHDDSDSSDDDSDDSDGSDSDEDGDQSNEEDRKLPGLKSKRLNDGGAELKNDRDIDRHGDDFAMACNAALEGLKPGAAAGVEGNADLNKDLNLEVETAIDEGENESLLAEKVGGESHNFKVGTGEDATIGTTEENLDVVPVTASKKINQFVVQQLKSLENKSWGNLFENDLQVKPGSLAPLPNNKNF